MLTVTKISDDRLDLELTGMLDADMMALALDDLIEKSEGIEHGKMMYSIPEFEMPTAGALAIELTRLPGLFGLLQKFDRCAVLSNRTWLRTMAEIEGVMIPGLEIKAFEYKDAEAAEAWLEST